MGSPIGARLRIAAAGATCVERLESRALLSAGAIDSSFGTGGRQLTQFFGSNIDAGRAVARQSDGKVVVAGTTQAFNAAPQFAVGRYNADGSLDPTFGTGGRVSLPVGAYDKLWAMTLQSDGKIVLAGQSAPVYDTTDTKADFAVVRLNTDGSPDTTFNGTGKETFDFAGNEDIAQAVAIDPSGRILLGGYTLPLTSGGTAEHAMVRLNADGSLDTTFGGIGMVATDIAPGSESIHAIAFDSQGGIITAGNSGSGLSFHFCVARYNDDGSLDASFGGNGTGSIVTAVGTANDVALALTVGPDGKIVAAGQALNSSSTAGMDIGVARYNFDGTLDDSFGSLGREKLDLNKLNNSASSVSVTSDGHILLAGNSVNGNTVGTYVATVARLTSSGALDTSYNGTGWAVAIGGDMTAAEIEPDGSVTGGGILFTSANNQQDMLAVRYTPDGTPDNTFGAGGRVTTDFIGGTFSRGFGVVIQADGKAVVGGNVLAGQGRADDFALARYNPDGSLDSTFGSQGIVTTDFGGKSEDIAALVLQPNGDLVAAGNGYDAAGKAGMAIARYLPDGQLDSTFGNGGTQVVTSFGADSIGIPYQSNCAALALQADGSIVLAGDVWQSGSGTLGLAVARLTPAGRLDPTFHGTGTLVTLPQFGKVQDGQAVAIDSTGRIVVAGSTTQDQALVARYLPSGNLDTSFAGTGLLQASLPSSGSIDALAIQPADGKILIGGQLATATEDFFLARYNTNGTADSTFGTAGKVTTDLGADDYLSALAVLPDGAIMAAGTTGSAFVGSTNAIGLARYTSSGVLDPAFGSGGKVTANYGDFAAEVSALAVRPDGNIVVAGIDAPQRRGPVYMMVAQFIGVAPPPRVTAASFAYDLAPDSLSFTFSQDVSHSLSLASIQIENLTTATFVTPARFTWVPDTRTAVFTLPSGTLADGNYQARLFSASIVDGSGNHLDGSGTGAGGDFLLPFFWLQGDLNHDRTVGFSDLLTLAQNYGQSNATWSRGDLNYDGAVNFADLLALAQNYGHTVPAPAAAAFLTTPLNEPGLLTTQRRLRLLKPAPKS